MAGGMGHGSGSQSTSANEAAAALAARDGATGGKGTSQSVPAPSLSQMGTGGIFGSQQSEAHPITHSAGKGTNEAAPTGTQDIPSSVTGQYSGRGGNWRDTLARGIMQQQRQAAAIPAPSSDYGQMVSQALLGKDWKDLVPAPAKKEEPAAAAAPAPDKVAALEAQIAALQRAQQAATAAPYDPYPGATMTSGAAHGGAIHGYARGGMPADDDIVKIALALLRRYQ